MKSFNVLIFTIVFVAAYLVTTKMPVFPEEFGKIFTLGKDASLCAMIVIFSLIKLRRPYIHINSPNTLVVILILVLFVYAVISPMKKLALLGFVQLASAPTGFLILSNLSFHKKQLFQISKVIYTFLAINIILGLIIYLSCHTPFLNFFQAHEYFQETGIGVSSLYRIRSEGTLFPRLVGVAIQPNETASICIFLILFSSIHVSNRSLRYLLIFLFALTLGLTTARSPFFGLIAGWLLLKGVELQRFSRIIFFSVIVLAIVTFFSIAVFSFEQFIPFLDASSLVHLSHLVQTGPEKIAESWHGLGIGMAGRLIHRDGMPLGNIESIWFESEYLMLIVQIGIFGFMIFGLTIFSILKKIYTSANIAQAPEINAFCRKSILLFLALCIGNITFPLLSSSRLMSYLVWFYAALSSSICRSSYAQTPCFFTAHSSVSDDDHHSGNSVSGLMAT